VLGVSGFVHKPLTPEIIESVTLKALNDAETAEMAVESEADAEIKPVEETDILRKTGIFAKNVGLFFAAPFIALAYIIALPFVGFYMFAKLGYQAWTKKHPSA
jgi:hypothetical protein